MSKFFDLVKSSFNLTDEASNYWCKQLSYLLYIVLFLLYTGIISLWAWSIKNRVVENEKKTDTDKKEVVQQLEVLLLAAVIFFLPTFLKFVLNVVLKCKLPLF
jgi:uncharacterized membrane protein